MTRGTRRRAASRRSSMLTIRWGRMWVGFSHDVEPVTVVAVRIPLTLLLLSLIPSAAAAEDGHAAWLRYAALEPAARARLSALVPETIVALGDAAPLLRARDELIR